MKNIFEEKRAILKKEFSEMLKELCEWTSFESVLTTFAIFVGCIAFLFGFGVAMI